MSISRVALFVLMSLLAGSVLGQRRLPDQLMDVRVRVLGVEDGAPRPGVLLHLAPLSRPEPGADGWLVAEDPKVLRLRAARTVRTDPEGRAVLRVQPTAFMRELFVGEPFALVDLVGAHRKLVAAQRTRRDPGELELRVFDNEPVGVRVIDSDGQRLADFPVALHAEGREMSHAVTDKNGNAILGAPRGYKGRLTVVPSGWCGPKTVFPTVAESLKGRRFARLEVPPFGELRLQVQRRGAPVRAKLGSVSLYGPRYEPYATVSTNGFVQAKGIVMPRAALGLEIQGMMYVNGKMPKVEARGPVRKGEVTIVNVGQGSWKTLKLRVAGAGFRAGERVAVRIVTDAGTWKETAVVAASGAVSLTVSGQAAQARELVRVDVDYVRRPPTGPEAWSVAVLPQRAIDADVIDIGVVTPKRHPLMVRGKVVDRKGQPVAGASVALSPADKSTRGFMATSDDEGRFEWQGALYRDSRGELVDVIATARLGRLRSPASEPLPVGADVTLTLPAEGQAIAAARRHGQGGTLVVRVPELPAKVGRTIKVTRGMGFANSARNVVGGEGGHLEFHFEGLVAGTYDVCADHEDYRRFVVARGFEVVAGQRCEDPRLESLEIMKRVELTTVHVADAQGVPIVRARMTVDSYSYYSDQAGKLQVLLDPDAAGGAVLEVEGKRPMRLPKIVDGAKVVMGPPGTITVTVRGIPPELPRGNLQVILRPEERNSAWGPDGAIQEGDVVTLPLPVAGRYFVRLAVASKAGNGTQFRFITQTPELITIGAEAHQTAVLDVDDAAKKRLREALK